ncbi:protein tyrosine phosphatase [Hahella aquimaris]|uniref:protein tyrosine phosphatase n=1 Tax=Hahella sp. HNIBRBA332 TaxID=3015983 RepID=UPI00273AF2DA|nr:protein tyrosine phosphatase [Hahella sp. HNIBRBA332]WLQ15967.1 protein tyrosine phosphatase [Hahella sp. HNIBRBA332]
MTPRVAKNFLTITCLWNAERRARECSATHVVSLLDPDLDSRSVPDLSGVVREHHILRLYDQERAGETQHFDALIADALARLKPVTENPENRLVIHCHAGVSRSTALGYGVLSLLHGEGKEADAFNDLTNITCKPWPNRRIVEVIDSLLGRDGRMLSPLDAYRSQHPFRLQSYRRLNKKRGIVSRVER